MIRPFVYIAFSILISSAHALDCPKGMVAFSNFCMDQYEAPNIFGARPFVAQTATDGHEWCTEKGKRLCREDEWLFACEGKLGRKYPYGNKWRQNICNDTQKWIPPNWGDIQQYPLPRGVREVNKLNQSRPAGSYKECHTPEGVFDLGGNVSEWVIKTEYHTTDWDEVMMGCYWSGCYGKNRGIERSICRGTNAGHPGTRGFFRTYEAGFRCCL